MFDFWASQGRKVEVNTHDELKLRCLIWTVCDKFIGRKRTREDHHGVGNSRDWNFVIDFSSIIYVSP